LKLNLYFKHKDSKYDYMVAYGMEKTLIHDNLRATYAYKLNYPAAIILSRHIDRDATSRGAQLDPFCYVVCRAVVNKNGYIFNFVEI